MPSLFISYSHKDAFLMEQLATHLDPYQRAGLLDIWDDRRIRAGQAWAAEIKRAIQCAKVAVLLISSDFLASDFICGEEIPRILERRIKAGLIVVPVILKTCNWQGVSWLQGTQARPSGKPLFGLTGNKRHKALAEIAQEITELLQAKPSPRTALPQTAPTEIPRAIHQLPPPPGDFTGRAAELEALKSAVRKGATHVLFGLYGLGGVGKTALALKLAHEITPLYPDGQIFLDLLGVTTPLSTVDAMAHVIRSFHPGNQLPTSETDLAGLYRSVLHGKRVLLLMDNAAGRDQVEPLLPQEGSAFLVTSRVRFTLPGLLERDLDKLSQEESRELLITICDRTEAHADDLAKFCGDLPLALRVAASTLQERLALSPETYLQRLSSGRERFEEVETALSLSHDLLSEELRFRWLQLAVFPYTFDKDAAASLWEVDVEDAERGLSELVRHSLVEWKSTSTRYRLHDLVRSFVNNRLVQAERLPARERHARHYLEVLQSANDLYLKGGTDLVLGLKLFDLEWRNIQAAQAFSVEANQSEEGARLCTRYPSAGLYCLDLRQTSRERIVWLDAALVAARRLNDRAAEGWHLGNLGLAYADLGEFEQAIEFHKQALAIAREIGDRKTEAKDLGNLGNAYTGLGQPRRAIEFHEQALTIDLESSDRRGEANDLGNLGLAYHDLGEYHRAIELSQQVLAIYREIGDRRGEGKTLGNLGSAYAKLGQRDRAIKYYEQKLSIVREIGARRGEAIASWCLGLIYENEDPERAVHLMQFCVDFEREIGHKDAEADAAYVEAIRARIKP